MRRPWSPARLARPQDNITSSPFLKNRRFKPSCENEDRENMYYIMTEEYRRLWFKDLKQYLDVEYAPKESYSANKRKPPKRDMKKIREDMTDKKKKLAPIKLKKFQNISSRTNHQRTATPSDVASEQTENAEPEGDDDPAEPPESEEQNQG